MSGPVERWLETFMCKQYAKLFEAYGFKTLHSVCQLQLSTLHSMGIAPEHCDKILENVSVLRQSLVGSVGSNYSDHGYNHQMAGHGQNNGTYAYHSPSGYSAHHSYGNPNGQMNHNMQYSSGGEMYQGGQAHYGSSRPDMYGQSMYSNNHMHPNHTAWEEPVRIYNHSPRHVIGSSPSPAPSSTMMRSPPPPVPSPTVMGIPQHYSRHGILDHPPPQAAHHHPWPQNSVMSPGMVNSPRGTPSPGMGHPVVPSCSPVHGKPFSPPPYSPHPPPAHQQTVGYDYPPPPSRNLSPSQALPSAQQATQGRHLGSPQMNQSSDPLQSLQKMVMLEPPSMRGSGSSRPLAIDGSPEALLLNKTGGRIGSVDPLAGCGTPSPCSSYASLKSKTTDSSMSPAASESSSKSSGVAASPTPVIASSHHSEPDVVTVPAADFCGKSPGPQSNGVAGGRPDADWTENGVVVSSPEEKASSVEEERHCDTSQDDASGDGDESKSQSMGFSDVRSQSYKKLNGKKEQILPENGHGAERPVGDAHTDCETGRKPPVAETDCGRVASPATNSSAVAKVEGLNDVCRWSSSSSSSSSSANGSGNGNLECSGAIPINSQSKAVGKKKGRRHVQRTDRFEVRSLSALKKQIVVGDQSKVNGGKCANWNVEISPELKLVAKKVEPGKLPSEDRNCYDASSVIKVSSAATTVPGSVVAKQESKPEAYNRSDDRRSLRRSKRLNAVLAELHEKTPKILLKNVGAECGLKAAIIENKVEDASPLQDLSLRKVLPSVEEPPPLAMKDCKAEAKVSVNLEIVVPNVVPAQQTLPVVGVSPTIGGVGTAANGGSGTSNSGAGTASSGVGPLIGSLGPAFGSVGPATGSLGPTIGGTGAGPLRRKRGRPMGSKNKPRIPGSEKEARKSSTKKQKQSTEGGANAVAPIATGPRPEVAIPKKAPSEGVRPKGPYLHLCGTKDRPAGVTVVNVPSRDEDADPKSSSRWKPRFSDDHAAASKNRILSVGFRSTMSANYDVFTKDKTWICALCHKGSHHKGLGDLYGPYFEENSLAPQSQGESACEGRTADVTAAGGELQVTGRKVREKRKRSELVEEFFKTTMAKKGKRAKESLLKRAQLPLKIELGDNKMRGAMAVVPCEDEDSAAAVCTSTKEFWVHEDCIAWAHGVYLVGHKIIGLKEAVASASESACTKCSDVGATIGCHQKGCPEQYHYLCAIEKGCSMTEETFVVLCARHKKKS